MDSSSGFIFIKENSLKKSLNLREVESRESENNSPNVQKRYPFQMNSPQNKVTNPGAGSRPSKTYEEEYNKLLLKKLMPNNRMRSHFRPKEDPYDICNTYYGSITKLDQSPQ